MSNWSAVMERAENYSKVNSCNRWCKGIARVKVYGCRTENGLWHYTFKGYHYKYGYVED